MPRPWWHVTVAGLLVASTYSGFGLYESLGYPLPRIPLSPEYVLYACAACVALNALLAEHPNVRWWVETLRGSNEPPCPASPHRSRLPWLLIGFLFLAAMLALLEHMQPGYFNCDDNTVQFLPMIIFGARSLLHGSFPQWNPHQFMGMPAASSGIYALTYPLTYVSYGVARYVLHNEYWTTEVFIIGHLVLGYFTTVWAVRTMRIRQSLCVLAALCCVLSGFALLASRNWYYMSPVFTWVPLMAGGLVKLTEDPRPRWVVFFGVAGGLFFHAGNVQMWSYSLLLLGLGCIVMGVCGTTPLRHLLLAGCAFGLAVGVAAPLMFVQAWTTRGVLRPMSFHLGRILIDKFAAFLVPGTWLGIQRAQDWTGNQAHYGSAIVYSGTLFVLLSCVLLLTTLTYRWDRKDVGRNVWLVCCLLAFLCGLGFDGPFWPLLLRTPGFGNFRLPFKFLGLFNIFAALSGALALERVLRRVRMPKWWEGTLFAGVLVLLVFHCSFARSSFYKYSLTYDGGSSVVRSYLQPKNGDAVRFLPIIPLRSPSPDFQLAYPFDLPSMYGLYSAVGLDGLADWAPAALNARDLLNSWPERALPEFGITYVLLHKLADQPTLTAHHPEAAPLEMLLDVEPKVVQTIKAEGMLVYSDSKIMLFKVHNPRPLGFVTADSSRRVAVRFKPSGVLADVAGLSPYDHVTINVLCRPELRAYADGRRIRHSCDPWQRVEAEVPAQARILELKFEPPWWKGWVLGAILAVGSIGMAVVLSNRGSKNEAARTGGLVVTSTLSSQSLDVTGRVRSRVTDVEWHRWIT